MSTRFNAFYFSDLFGNYLKVRGFYRATKVNRQLACKPGSVWLRREPERGSHSSGTAFARCLSQPTRMTGLETSRKAFRPAASSLFGLAPGGVYRAISVAGDAVGSYPTLSPLPARTQAVCFLWHFP